MQYRQSTLIEYNTLLQCHLLQMLSVVIQLQRNKPFIKGLHTFSGVKTRTTP